MTVEATAPIDPYRRGMPSARTQTEQDFSFADALDIVNPLQHIPGIGWLYREITGDTIKTPAAIAGGALYGGALGFAGAFLAAAFESLTGEAPETLLTRAVAPTDGRQATAAYERATALAEAQIQR